MPQSYQKRKNRHQGPTFLEVMVLGIFKGLWFLIKLPFKGWQRKKGLSPQERSHIIVKRQEIEKLSESESPIELKHAVFEADKLVDHILKIKNYTGETFADRLRSAQNDIDRTTYQAIWDGHKIRNQLAHEDLVVSSAELKQAIKKLLNFAKNA